MRLRKKEFPLRKIRGRKEQGKVSFFVGLYFALFLALFLYASLQTRRLQAASLYLEDALAASNLGAAMVNLKEYGKSHKILVADPYGSFETYRHLIGQNLNLDENNNPPSGGVLGGPVEIVCFIIYNVEGETVTEYYFRGDGSKSVEEKAFGEVFAPNGRRIENTSIYSELRFEVKCFPDVYVNAQKGNLVDIVSMQ